MKKDLVTVSELEGAILGEIAQAAETTAYAVRKSFATSLSNELSASKGAIYPAIARLVSAGLVRAKAVSDDGRGAQKLTLTAAGEKVLLDWACNEAAAIGAGIDPFRMRSGLWPDLPEGRQKALQERLKKAIRERISLLEDCLEDFRGSPNEIRVELEIELQETRLRFISRAFRRTTKTKTAWLGDEKSVK